MAEQREHATARTSMLATAPLTQRTPTTADPEATSGARILIASATQALSSRVPEVISHPHIAITVAGAERGSLIHSAYVDSYITVAARPADFARALADHPIAHQHWDWVLWDDDATMRALLETDTSQAIKERLLPASEPLGQAALGSKVGQQLLAETADIPTPRTVIANTTDDVWPLAGHIGTPLLVKGDRGGGGAHLWRLNSTTSADRRRLERQRHWIDAFPVVVQEYVDGIPVSVEPLYRRGQLLAYLYADFTSTTGGPFGPSTSRNFRAPRAADMDSILRRLGEVGGLHGFGNLTFIWCPLREQHLLIECDMRINTWVQFGPQLGIDWAGLLLDGRPLDPPHAEPKTLGRHIHLFPRDLQSAATEWQPSRLRPWLTRAPGTWDARNRSDASVNAEERRAVLQGIALKPLQAAWNRLPNTVRSHLERRGLKRRVLRSLGIHI